MDAIPEGCGGEFAGCEFGGGHAHDVTQEEAEGAFEVSVETAGGKMIREAKVGWWLESPGQAVEDRGRGFGGFGFKKCLDAFEEGVFGLKE